MVDGISFVMLQDYFLLFYHLEIFVFLYFLFDMFHTNDIQKNNILLLNFDKSTESILLSDSDNTEISNEYAFASDLIHVENNDKGKTIEKRSNSSTYKVLPVIERVDKPSETERDIF